MGYTHHWQAPTVDELSPECAETIQRLFNDHYPHLIQKEADNPKPPHIIPTVIIFNGIGDDGHETFLFRIRDSDFCKTAEKPYDVIVVAVLTIIKHFHPDGFNWRSDGDDEDLADGRQLAMHYTH